MVQEDVSPLIRASLISLNNFGMVFVFFSGLNPASYALTRLECIILP